MPLTFAAVAASLVVALAGLAMPERAAAAHHEPVIQTYVVTVQAGKEQVYVAEVRKLQAAMKRLGSPATVRMWRATAAGPDTGNLIVGVEYPNAAAWATDQPKIEGDAEFRKIQAGLPEMRSVESRSLWKDISPNAAAPAAGKVLVVTGVQVNPDKLQEYRRRVGSAQAISDRLGLSGRLRMWHAELAGPATGNVAVGIEYPDLATYVADQAKLSVDPEWQKLLEGLGEIRTLGGRWLYEAVPL